MKSKITKTAKAHSLSYDDFFNEISLAWERRAKELQARRWSKIKRQEMEGVYHVRHSPS